MSKPNFPFYAVIENEYVIDCAFPKDNNNIVSPVTKHIYTNNKDVLLVPMTEENSPAYIGMKYKDNKFYYEGETNV
jgi:hypothetical protein